MVLLIAVTADAGTTSDNAVKLANGNIKDSTGVSKRYQRFAVKKVSFFRKDSYTSKNTS